MVTTSITKISNLEEKRKLLTNNRTRSIQKITIIITINVGNNKSYHKPYTQGDRYTTTRLNNSPSQNNQTSDKNHKKQIDTNKDSNNNVLCL